MRLCAINDKQLDELFASVNQNPHQTLIGLRISETTFSSPSITELSTVLAALRKLREAITATSRKDAFARRAYFFMPGNPAIDVPMLMAWLMLSISDGV